MFEPKMNFYYPGEQGTEEVEHGNLQDILDDQSAPIATPSGKAPIIPRTREEHYLAKIAGEETDVPEPKTRLEYYLAAIAGEEVDCPNPKTRLEYFLKGVADNGDSSDGGFSGGLALAQMTVTLNIDTPSKVKEIDTGLAEFVNGSWAPVIIDNNITAQMEFSGNVLPLISKSGKEYDVKYSLGLKVYDVSDQYDHVLILRNAENYDFGKKKIIDPTKPASLTFDVEREYVDM